MYVYIIYGRYFYYYRRQRGVALTKFCKVGVILRSAGTLCLINIFQLKSNLDGVCGSFYTKRYSNQTPNQVPISIPYP